MSGANTANVNVVCNTVPIIRHGNEVGRIRYDGRNVLVEELLADGFRLLGFYEQTQASTFRRKVREINEIFDAWRALPINDGTSIKANWRRAKSVKDFLPPRDAVTTGCTVLEQDGIEIAKIYKIRPMSAVLVRS